MLSLITNDYSRNNQVTTCDFSVLVLCWLVCVNLMYVLMYTELILRNINIYLF
jgi:hypothetical protein